MEVQSIAPVRVGISLIMAVVDWVNSQALGGVVNWGAVGVLAFLTGCLWEAVCQRSRLLLLSPMTERLLSILEGMSQRSSLKEHPTT